MIDTREIVSILSAVLAVISLSFTISVLVCNIYGSQWKKKFMR